jgi:hypothetical protein
VKRTKRSLDTERTGPSFGGVLHGFLDAVGAVPVLGDPANAINCLWYGAESDHLNAGLSCTALIPVVGDVAIAAKWARRGEEVAQVARAARASEVAKVAEEGLGSGRAYSVAYETRLAKSSYPGVSRGVGLDRVPIWRVLISSGDVASPRLTREQATSRRESGARERQRSRGCEAQST